MLFGLSAHSFLPVAKEATGRKEQNVALQDLTPD
jgi:hypothetical protein